MMTIDIHWRLASFFGLLVWSATPSAWSASGPAWKIESDDHNLPITVPITSSSAQADWQRFLTAFDQQRIAHFSRALQEAINIAGDNDKTSPRHYVNSIYSLKKLPIDEKKITGHYICRSTGIDHFSSVVYNWFPCEIYKDGGYLFFQKAKGSQKNFGRLFRLSESEMIYAGSWHFNRKTEYIHKEPSVGDNCNNHRNKVSILNKISDGYYVMGFPENLCTPLFEVIEIKKKSATIPENQ